jgi:two-component system NtrC family sensor kinase
MLAGVVHEINNPLAVIQGYAQLLHERAVSEDDRRDLQCILDETRRLATLVEDMLSFTRRGTEAVEVVDLQRVVQAAVNLTTHDMRQARVTVVASLPREPCSVRGSHGVYVQVLLNLLANARHSLEAAPTVERGIVLRVEPPTAAARAVDLVVSNNGPPIEPALREAIFEPFFTTKGEGEGSGLGLALCRELLARYGASLALDPSGAGSPPVSFRLTLPRC